MKILLIIIAVLAILVIILQFKRRRRTLSSLNSFSGLYKKPFETLINQAKESYLLKEYHRVIAIADQILEILPKSHETLLLRALSLEVINYNLESIEDFELANLIKEIDANTTGLLGLTYKKIGDFEKGQEYLKQSIEKGSNTYKANYNANKLASPLVIELFKSKSNIPENFCRRKRNDFIKYLTESDKNNLIDGLKKQIHNLEISIATYPNDNEFLRLYDRSKSILCKLETTATNLTSISNKT